MDQTPTDNPYAAPVDFETSIPGAGVGDFEVRGKTLLVRDGATLPPRCIKSNEPVTPGETGRLKKVKMAWINPWWLLLIFLPFGIFVLLILSIFKTERGTMMVSLSKRAVRKKRLTIAFWSGLTALLIVFGISRMPVDAAIGGSCIFGSLITLIITLYSSRYLTTANHKDGWFVVKGFNREFLNEIERGS